MSLQCHSRPVHRLQVLQHPHHIADRVVVGRQLACCIYTPIYTNSLCQRTHRQTHPCKHMSLEHLSSQLGGAHCGTSQVKPAAATTATNTAVTCCCCVPCPCLNHGVNTALRPSAKKTPSHIAAGGALAASILSFTRLQNNFNHSNAARPRSLSHSNESQGFQTRKAPVT